MRQHRIQARHRLLEDHRDVVAADASHLDIGQRQQFGAAELDAAADAAVAWGISRMIDSAVTLLPEPDSPTIATVSFGAMSNETLWTTSFHFPSTRKAVVRSATDRIGWLTSEFSFGSVIRSRTAFERVSLSPMRRGEEDSSTHEKCE